MEKLDYIASIKADIAKLNELVETAVKASTEDVAIKIAEQIGEVGTDIFAKSDSFLQL